MEELKDYLVARRNDAVDQLRYFKNNPPQDGDEVIAEANAESTILFAEDILTKFFKV